MAIFLFVVLSSSVFFYSDAASKPCAQLTSCAVEKCLDMGTMENIVKTTQKDALFGAVVEKFDVLCMAAKCRKECRACRACHYALEQISALAQGAKTSGECPKLETCVHSCLGAELKQVVKCVASKCNMHCYDGDCPDCSTVSKHMFSRICKQMSITSLPNVKYDGTCPALFTELADNYVSAARQRLGK